MSAIEEHTEEQEKRQKRSLLAQNFINELRGKLLERDELSALIVLTVFSAQNMLLIGKPGVGKTRIVNLVLKAVLDAESFEYLMMYSTKAEAIFGSSHIAPNGEMVQNTKHTILQAHFALIDEIFKGNDKAINHFLGITSESRIFHREGMEPLRVPLISFFAASNELHQGEVLDAMNDRLLFRYIVRRIEKDDNFLAMIEDNFDVSDDFKSGIKLNDLISTKRDALSLVSIPKGIAQSYNQLKKKLIVEENMDASDRRLKHAISPMKVSAYLNNRNEIDESDIFLLQHIIWNTYAEEKQIKIVLRRHFFSSLEYIKKLLQNAENDFSQINTLKQTRLNDFLLKKSQISVSKIESYFEEHSVLISIIMQKLEESYAIISSIKEIKKRGENIRNLIKNNIFVPDERDRIFVGLLTEELSACEQDYKSLYLYLENFKKSCPNARAYMEYKGE